MFRHLLAVAGLCQLALVAAQSTSDTPPNSFPQVYPGQPSGDLSPDWQNYFQVNDSLPNITFPLNRSFAGNIGVNRPGHDNDTLFFWAFEKENGSLTTNGSTDPWLIWLQGGPGSSSMTGLILENGPMRIQDDLSMKENEFAWTKLVDSVYVDNPVGVGFATADSTGYVLDDDQMGTDFVQFLDNFVKVFPGLASRPLIIAGESYAGRWIPYVTKAIFSTPNPPVKLWKIAIGDGTVGSFPVTQDMPVVSLIETYPQMIGYDTDVLNYFREQTHLCGFDLNFSYPETNGPLPVLEYSEPTDPDSPYNVENAALFRERMFRSFSSLQMKSTLDQLSKRSHSKDLLARDLVREAKRESWKRDLSQRANGTLDSWYACFLLTELYDYMVNFTVPWNADASGAALDVYDVSDGLEVKAPTSPAGLLDPAFFQDDQVVAALHAPTSKQWVESATYPFNSTFTLGDISPDPQDFLTELASNASSNGVSIIFYSGNDDSLLPHRGTEATIQNTTFGGTQGFMRKPSTPWTDDSGKFAGIIHQERNWTYVLFDGASHLVPQKQPAAAFTFLREFVLGTNQTGFFSSDSNSVVGGEDSALAGDFLPGTSVIFAGSFPSTSTVTYPAATVSAWDAAVSSITVAQAAVNNAQNSASSFHQGAALLGYILTSIMTCFLMF